MGKEGFGFGVLPGRKVFLIPRLFKDLSVEMKKCGPVKGLSPNKVSHLTKRITRLKEELEAILY
jgi:hypothetical protein